MDGRHARFVLGVGNNAGPTEIRRAFRARALVTHPDHGGDNRSFTELVDALAAVGTFTVTRTFTPSMPLARKAILGASGPA